MENGHLWAKNGDGSFADRVTDEGIRKRVALDAKAESQENPRFSSQNHHILGRKRKCVINENSAFI